MGGTNSFEEDSEIVSKSQGEVLFFVKSWEPPTMDFVDYLEELSQKVDKVVLLPVGTSQEAYHTSTHALKVWANKLVLIADKKVWLKI